MSVATCAACLDAGEVDLPSRDGLVRHRCPVCRPWPQGFPGAFIMRTEPLDDGTYSITRHWIISPAGPGEVAAYHGAAA